MPRIRPRVWIAAALLAWAPVHAFAVSIPKGMELPACAEYVADHYAVPLNIVHAVRIAEGGKVGQAVCNNKNPRAGACDLGPMQINEGWLDGRWGISLERDFGITRETLLHDECTNIAIGAWVLAREYNRYGDWFKAITAYNAGTPNSTQGKTYAERVFRWKKRIPEVEKEKPSLWVIRANTN